MWLVPDSEEAVIPALLGLGGGSSHGSQVLEETSIRQGCLSQAGGVRAGFLEEVGHLNRVPT